MKGDKYFHCSQAVFGAFAEKLGLSEELALKIGGCFYAGMNKGEVCGSTINSGQKTVLVFVGIYWIMISENKML